LKGHFKTLAGLAAAALAVALLAGPAAQAQNPTPANKTAAIGNTVDDQAPNSDHVVLSEELRVSSPADFILNLSAECSILTQLVTGDDGTDATGTADTTGQVTMYITIDGKRVPVAGDANGDNGDNGEVVFCNREYARSVTDNEDAPDGQDREADYLRTRSANAFQWLATNVGTAYDDVALNGQNIIQVDVHAVYTDQDATSGVCQPDFSETCSQAFVGKRTLIVEHTKASVIENTASSGGGS
jgi:hypothetical protein